MEQDLFKLLHQKRREYITETNHLPETVEVPPDIFAELQYQAMRKETRNEPFVSDIEIVVNKNALQMFTFK